jgi:hypothetical protein
MSKEIEALIAKNQELQSRMSFLEMENENMAVQLNKGPAVPSLDCVAYITIKHMSNGGLQFSGCIGDTDWCIQVLTEALDTVKRLGKKTNLDAPRLVGPTGQPVVSIPASETDAKQTIPTHAFGDAPPGQRGDMPPA